MVHSEIKGNTAGKQADLRLFHSLSQEKAYLHDIPVHLQLLFTNIQFFTLKLYQQLITPSTAQGIILDSDTNIAAIVMMMKRFDFCLTITLEYCMVDAPVYFVSFILFLMENPVPKQCRP